MLSSIKHEILLYLPSFTGKSIAKCSKAWKNKSGKGLRNMVKHSKKKNTAKQNKCIAKALGKVSETAKLPC